MLKTLSIALLALYSTTNSDHQDWGERTAIVYATIQHSEWCPAGNIQLDLTTGDFILTDGADRRICNDEELDRPKRSGNLSAKDLRALRHLFESAKSEGLEEAACRYGGEPDRVVISNGGVPTLVLTFGAWTESAPDRLGCWSNSATKLHKLLDDIFIRDREAPGM